MTIDFGWMLLVAIAFAELLRLRWRVAELRKEIRDAGHEIGNLREWIKSLEDTR